MTANAYSFCHELSQALLERGGLPLLLVVFEECPWRLQKGQRYQHRNKTHRSGAAKYSFAILSCGNACNDLWLRFESDLQALWVGLEGSKNPSGPNTNSNSRMWCRKMLRVKIVKEHWEMKVSRNVELTFLKVFFVRDWPSWAPISQECWWWSWKICGWERSRAWQLWTRRTPACEWAQIHFWCRCIQDTVLECKQCTWDMRFSCSPWSCRQIQDFAKRNRLDAQAAVKLGEVRHEKIASIAVAVCSTGVANQKSLQVMENRDDVDGDLMKISKPLSF